VKAVVFDKDGVLADSESINLLAAFEVFRAHGYELGPEDEPAIVGTGSGSVCVPSLPLPA
jgi:beta-phosphoglucomutase-like phosphatase (HAD superfamily)